MQALYKLEKTLSIPDLRINVGVRDFRSTGDLALVSGVSIPIPVFNRNQGNVKRALQNVTKAEYDFHATKILMVNALHEQLENQVNAYRSAKNIKFSILPAAEKAFTFSRQGYLAGKFSYLEVLDAERTLFAMRESYITTLKNYHIAKAEVERMSVKNLTHIAIKEGSLHAK